MINKTNAYCITCKRWDVPLHINFRSKSNIVSCMCRECRRIKTKKYYSENKERVKAIIKKSTKKHYHKQKARVRLNYHVKAGNINKPSSCEECGVSDCRIEGAHTDYSRPLDVRWLCKPCHYQFDK